MWIRGNSIFNSSKVKRYQADFKMSSIDLAFVSLCGVVGKVPVSFLRQVLLNLWVMIPLGSHIMHSIYLQWFITLAKLHL